MFRRSALVQLALVICITLSSCAKREERVVAKVGSKLITVGDMEGAYRPRPDWTSEQADSAKTATLNKVVDDKLMAWRGEQLGYRGEEETTEGLEDVKKRAMVNELYQKVVVERTRVSEGEVKKYYDRLGHEIKARHILVGSEEQADSIYDELTREGGRSFDDLAKECSTDRRTQDKGGDLGWIKWGRMPDEFQKAAFSMKVGETSRPIKTRLGYHIVKVEDRREAERRPWEEESSRIRQQLERTEMKELADRFLERLKEIGRIEVDEDVLKILAEKTPKQERAMFAPPPLPAVTDEDREMVLMTSVLGEWTVGKVLEEAEKLTRRPPFDQLDRIKGFAEWLVTNELLLREAERYHLDRSRKVTQQVENEIDRRMADRVTREEINAKAEASDEEIEDYYAAHIEEYSQPERVKASQIVVETEKEAREILRKLRSGADFAELARERSTHWTKNRGGDLGLFERGKYPDIEDVAFSLRKGKLSDILETKDGFTILKVIKKEPEKTQSLDEVRAVVENRVLREKREKLKEEMLSGLREEVEVAVSRRNLRLVGAGG